MPTKTYITKEKLQKRANEIIDKSIRQFIPGEKIREIEERVEEYNGDRKGYLGDLIEVYLFDLPNNGRAEADFMDAGVELKTTPLKKHKKFGYAAKERLVFSMIDYMSISGEKWETSSFLKKNKVLLIMFYLYLENINILDLHFKHVELLNLLSDISSQDILQIKEDWEFIRAKISRGEAHLLSEGDTYYLGACTKSSDSTRTRQQPSNTGANHVIPAKPRAFSFKPTYINYLLRKNILHKEDRNTTSILSGKKSPSTIDEAIDQKFKPFIGKTDKQITNNFKLRFNKKSKSYKRALANAILSNTLNNKIEELEKADITLRVITLEYTGNLKESISFPIFDYRELVTQEWFDEKTDTMSDFHEELERKKFLFVVFQKQKGSKDIFLKKIKFWNFPMTDLEEAKRVFEETKSCIKAGEYEKLPKISESSVSHVRPHGKNRKDTQFTPQGTKQVKRCFWLNAKYIQSAIEKN